MNSITTEDVKLIKEDGKYYLDCTFIAKNDRWIKRAHMPRVYLPIKWDGDISPSVFHPVDLSGEVNIGYGPTLAYPVHTNNENGSTDYMYAYTEEVLEEKVQEMTLAEVEKKLGYKIKIVNK